MGRGEQHPRVIRAIRTGAALDHINMATGMSSCSVKPPEERKIHDLSLQRPTLHLIQHFFFTFVHLSYIGIVLMFYLLPEMKAPGSYVIIIQSCADVMLQFPALYPGCFKA